MNITNASNGTSTLQLAGRILVGVLFLVAGIMKIMSVAGTTGYMTRLGFPAPQLFAYLSIVIEVGGGLLLILGWHTRKVAWLLFVYLLVATGAAHRFWEYEPAQRANQINHFLKNLALAGAMLFIARFGPGRVSLDRH
jgi:putative oxidoreductase